MIIGGSDFGTDNEWYPPSRVDYRPITLRTLRPQYSRQFNRSVREPRNALLRIDMNSVVGEVNKLRRHPRNQIFAIKGVHVILCRRIQLLLALPQANRCS